MAEFDTIPLDASGATSRDSWLETIDAIGEEAGFFQTVGPRHWAFFADESPTLLVSFETIDSARSRPGQMPFLQPLAEKHDWSHLCLIADGPTFWRDKAVWAFFDRMVDDAFFEDFDRVLFYGAGMGGYAAAAYAVAAPGANVLLAAPRATMDPAVTGWDIRDRAARRFDFRSRYGYAPDMIEGAAKVFLAFDPQERADAMHAALFRGPHVTPLAMPRIGPSIEAGLQRLGLFDTTLQMATLGTLNAASFARGWRKRRDDAAYLKTLLAQAGQSGHPAREKAICRNVATRLKLPRFVKRLSEIEKATGLTSGPFVQGKHPFS
jgi:hypothetical protein